jgi:hypothetical protein
MSLTLCPSCQRHVKSRDPRCPFCGHAVAASTVRRPGTAALLVGLGLAVGGCGSSAETTTPTPDALSDTQSETPMMDAAYGPPPDTGADTTPLIDAAYGPPPDTGADTAKDTGPETDTLPAGAYGPPPDTGAAAG